MSFLNGDALGDRDQGLGTRDWRFGRDTLKRLETRDYEL